MHHDAVGAAHLVAQSVRSFLNQHLPGVVFLLDDLFR